MEMCARVSVSQRCAPVSPLFINSLRRNLLARQDILPQLQHKQIPVGKKSTELEVHAEGNA